MAHHGRIQGLKALYESAFCVMMYSLMSESGPMPTLLSTIHSVTLQFSKAK